MVGTEALSGSIHFYESTTGVIEKVIDANPPPQIRIKDSHCHPIGLLGIALESRLSLSSEVWLRNFLFQGKRKERGEEGRGGERENLSSLRYSLQQPIVLKGLGPGKEGLLSQWQKGKRLWRQEERGENCPTWSVGSPKAEKRQGL